MSYLIQVRGLKPTRDELVIKAVTVVPYIGTWIETYKSENFEKEDEVVPYIGTWIETTCEPPFRTASKSYLIQVRGLKHIAGYRTLLYHPSYLIQVRGLKRQAAEMPTGDITSYLIQVRGLKLIIKDKEITEKMSYLIQVRGLKPSFCRYSTLCFYVVPYIGTWIETIRPSVKRYEQEVVPYIGTWIETAAKGQRPVRDRSYLIQVRGLKRCYFER